MNLQESSRKRKHSETCTDEPVKKQEITEDDLTGKSPPIEYCEEIDPIAPAHQHQSPKKRLEITPKISEGKYCNKTKFIYGNYNKYYGYRNNNKDCRDIRLDVFETQSSLFEHNTILDIGCNSGFITLEVAKRFKVRHITGIDIDRSLINQVNKYLTKQKKIHTNGKSRSEFPFNVSFLHANYILRDDVLLEIERPQFNVILCLSVTKWIQLNFGDAGLKQAFRRMFIQLQPGGKLILEAQPFDNYGRRKKMSDTIFKNYKAMHFFPKDFSSYLLSSDVGFKKFISMGVSDHCAAGFKRPIQIFYKE